MQRTVSTDDIVGGESGKLTNPSLIISGKKDNYQNIGRPRSMQEEPSSFDTDSSTLRKSFAPERSLVPALRPLSTMRSLSASMTSLSRRSDVPFGGSARGSFSVSKADYPKTRQDDGNPFQVDILKGITGIGAKVTVIPEGFTQIVEIQNGGPVDKIGQIRVGDYLLSVNNTELTGQTDARVQQILRLLPRGITKLVISSQIPILDNWAPDNCNNFIKAQNIVQGEKPNTFNFSTFGKHQASLDSKQPFMNLENNASPHFRTLARTTTRNSALSAAAAAQDIAQTEHMLTVIQNANNKEPDSYPVPAPRTKHNKAHHKFVPHPGNSISNYESQGAKTESSIHKHFGDISNQLQEDDIVFPVEESFVPAAKVNNSSRNYNFSQSIEGMYTRVPILRSSVGAPVQLQAETFMFQESRPASCVSSKVSFTQPQNFEHFQHREPEFYSSKLNDFAPNSLPIYMEKTEELYKQHSPRGKQARNSETSTERVEAFIITTRASINPGYLGRSKISSESSIKSEDSLDRDDVFVPNQEHAQSISYLRLQSIKGSSKPSAETDEPGASFMLFDPMTTNRNANSEPVVTAKRISVSVVTNSEISKPLNKSLMPLQDRHKNRGTSLSSYQPTPSSPAIHPRTASYSSAGAIDTTNTVLSPRNSENIYDRIKLTADSSHIVPSFSRNSESAYDKIKVNSPNMNSALSPKRTSSSDSPTTLSLNHPMKYTKTTKEPYWKSFHKENKDSEHLDTFTHASAITPNRNILSHLPRQKTSSYPSEHHSLPSATSVLSHFPSMSIKKNETALDSTMKKFDELLIDAPYTRTQTDPNDLLVWTPEIDKNLTSTQAKSMLRENLKEKIPQIKKHLTYLRKMRDSYGYEPEKLTKDKYEVQQEKDVKSQSREALIVDTMRKAAEKSFAELLDYVNWVDNLSPNHREADSNFSEKSSSNVLLDDNLSNLIIENKIYHRADNEMQQNDDSVMEFDKLLGSVSSKTYNTDENQDLSHFNELETSEHSLQLSQNVIGESRNSSYNNQKSKKTNMQDHESLNNLNGDNLNRTVVTYYNKEQNESQEDQVDFLKEKARQIVGDVIERIRANSYKFWENEKPASFIEPTSSTSPYDEPPSLPDTPPPLPSTLPPSLFPSEVSAPQIPHEFLDMSEPFLSDASIEHLVAGEGPSITWSLSNQPINDSAVSASIFKQQIENQPTESNITQHEIKTDKSVQNYTAEEDKESKADSTEVLNSTGDSFHDGYGVRGQSHSPFDMLSEDSGMAVDDDQEVATDDAISLPGEMAEAEPDSGRIIHFSSELAVELFSLPATKQESTGKLSKTTEKESFLQENEEFVDYVDGVFDKENVNGVFLPPLLPSFGKSVSSTIHDKLKSVDDIFSHNSTSIKMTPNIQQLPKDGLSNEINSGNQDIGIAVNEMVSSLKRPQEQMVSDSQGTNSYRVQSKRKWCLRSNLSRSAVLHGDSGIPVVAEYTEKNLLKSLPFNDLITLINKLNTVLDAGSAPLSLVLTVLHIHMDGDCIPLGIDLKQEGGTWFRVSGIKKGSPVWEEGGAQVGDWLIAVDSLWCDQVSVMRFLSRLAKPKHDTLLVFGREEESLDSSVSLAETKSHASEGNQLLPQNVSLLDDLKPVQSLCVKTSQPVKNAHFIDQQLTVDEQVPPLLDLVSMPSKVGALRDNGAPSHNDQPVAFFSRTQSPTHTDQAQAVPKTALLSSKDEILPRANNVDASVKDPASPQWMRSRNESITDQTESISYEHLQPEITSLSSGLKGTPKEEPSIANSIGKVPSHGLQRAEISQVKMLQSNEQLPAGKSAVISSSKELSSSIYQVIMMKGATGVGFCLEGGVDSPKGDMPITIKRIFKGGPAEKSGLLKVNDEILEVNGLDFTNMRHYEAWNHLKFLDDGEVHITVRRT